MSTKGKWHGHTDAGTAPKSFFYTRDNASSDIHPVQFKAVLEALLALTEVEDGNGSKVLQLIFTREEHITPVAAYRFTSDWACQQYQGMLIKLGSSLGRGGFQPWDPDSGDFERYVR